MSPKWLVLTWRLPASSSTPRVATWRSLRRLGAITLTPGAVVLPYSEQLLERLEWIAQEIVDRDGEAYVLPVTELSEAEEAEIRRRMVDERRDDYGELRESAEALAGRLAKVDAKALGSVDRFQFGRELAALERRFRSTVDRDHFGSPGRPQAERAFALAQAAGLSLQSLVSAPRAPARRAARGTGKSRSSRSKARSHRRPSSAGG